MISRFSTVQGIQQIDHILDYMWNSYVDYTRESINDY